MTKCHLTEQESQQKEDEQARDPEGQHQAGGASKVLRSPWGSLVSEKRQVRLVSVFRQPECPRAVELRSCLSPSSIEDPRHPEHHVRTWPVGKRGDVPLCRSAEAVPLFSREGANAERFMATGVERPELDGPG